MKKRVLALSLALLGLLSRPSEAAPPRAVAIVTAPPEQDVEGKARAARAALAALDEVQEAQALRTPALREALIPRESGADAIAEAQTLLAAAKAMLAKDASAAIALCERAMKRVFEEAPAARAHSFALANAESMEKAYLALGTSRGSVEPQRRLRYWTRKEPSGPTARLEIHVDPKEAEVFLDGWLIGPGPRSTAEHEPGLHDLRIELPGYRPFFARVNLGAAPTLEVKLTPGEPTHDVRMLLGEIDAGSASVLDLAPLLGRLAARLNVELVFVTTLGPRGPVVHLYDAARSAFTGVSPVAAADPPTLARAFRALFELQRTGAMLRRQPPPKTGKEHKPLWKKWWVWALIVGGAGAFTGAVYLGRQSGDEGTLTLRLRRSP